VECPVLASIRRMKAKAVMVMLEGKMGVENFAKVLQQMVKRAGAGDITAMPETAAAKGSPESTPLINRLVTTAGFLRLCRKVGGLQHAEVSALAERWVYGAGCPSIKVAFAYNK
jgi:hypothetical protein